ncbi:hypothetical protein ACFE04_029186 [Oxalis oulophora]
MPLSLMSSSLPDVSPATATATATTYSFDDNGSPTSPCSSISNGTICCDRTALRTDICFMKGDIRTNFASYSTFLYTSPETPASTTRDDDSENEFQREKIKPYTRKWEKSTMSTIRELDLVSKSQSQVTRPPCDVSHDVPAVFFSTGGYTGNVYHDINDGIIPLYITSQHFDKKVVFVILEYHDWWIMKYGDVLTHLTDYPVVDFDLDNRTHCFSEATVGLRIHDDLTIDPNLMNGNKTIVDLRNLLDRAYLPRITDLILEEEHDFQELIKLEPAMFPISRHSHKGRKIRPRKPKVVILSRNGSRAISNEDDLIRMAENIGFEVEVLKPDQTTELPKVYRALNSSDIMIGVHGAAMTYFLFMKPSSFFIQVIPLGTDWAADKYYGDPARKLGLKYIGYKILPTESSLWDSYDENDPVLTDPDSVNEKGWEFTKKVYLDGQNVKLDLERFHKHLARAYRYSKSRITNKHRPVRKYLL